MAGRDPGLITAANAAIAALQAQQQAAKETADAIARQRAAQAAGNPPPQ